MSCSLQTDIRIFRILSSAMVSMVVNEPEKASFQKPSKEFKCVNDCTSISSTKMCTIISKSNHWKPDVGKDTLC